MKTDHISRAAAILVTFTITTTISDGLSSQTLNNQAFDFYVCGNLNNVMQQIFPPISIKSSKI